MNPILRFLHCIYFYLIAFPIFLLNTAILSLVVIIGTRIGFGSKLIHWCGKLWSQIGLFLLLCPIKIEGKENIPNPKKGEGPFVVMANHQGGLDILMMYGYLPMPFRWVMKHELKNVPLMGHACACSGFIFVDEKTPSSIKQTMADARAVLADGKSIFIFPEGSRTFDGKMGRLKKGGFLMAYELGVPIIPVTINGSFEAYPRTRKWWYVQPTKLTLTVHPAVEIDRSQQHPKGMIQAITKVQESISSALPQEA